MAVTAAHITWREGKMSCGSSTVYMKLNISANMPPPSILSGLRGRHVGNTRKTIYTGMTEISRHLT